MGKRRQPKVTCAICGWEILAADGKCYRTKLHWTRESIAAEDAERKQRSTEPNRRQGC